MTPNIAAPIETLQRNTSSPLYLRGLKLAHLITTDEMLEIYLLIGADAYWKLIQNNTVRGNGPTVVQSKLGYLLSGSLPTTHRVHSRALNVISSRPSYYISTDNNKENTLRRHVLFPAVSSRQYRTAVPLNLLAETGRNDQDHNASFRGGSINIVFVTYTSTYFRSRPADENG